VTTQRSPSEKNGTHSFFSKPRLRDWQNKISYQLPEDSCVYFFAYSTVLWHAWVSRLHAGCKDSPVSVTSAGSRAQPHSLRPGIKLSYTRTVNRSSKWEQSSVMKRPSTAPRYQRYFLRDRETLRFLHSSLCTTALWMDTRSYSFTAVSFNSSLP